MIEWENVHPYNGTERWDFEVVLFEPGRVLFQYRKLDTDRERGNSATVGIENAAGTDALQFFDTASLANGLAIMFKRPSAGPF